MMSITFLNHDDNVDDSFGRHVNFLDYHSCRILFQINNEFG